MMRAIQFLAAAFLVVCAYGAQAQTSDGMKGVDEKWAAAAKKGDVEALVALYAPDATMYPPDALEARGTDAIRKSYTDMLGAMTVTEAVFDCTYKIVGDTAYGFGIATVTMQPKAGGAPQAMKVRVTEIGKKLNGKWVYVVDHASAPMAPPPSSK
jgi:uncharacterized protein (TIGR02246 family)